MGRLRGGKTLKARNLQPELMDDPDLSADLHNKALAGLRRINAMSGGAASIVSHLRRCSERVNRPLKMLDIACGGGDTMVRVASLARRRNLRVQVDGCDISAQALKNAEALAQSCGVESSRFLQKDVLKSGIPDGYDLVTCTLFLHHLTSEQATDLIREMANSCQLALHIDDLKRSNRGLLLAKAGCYLLSRSPIVRHDGPQSVRAAFTLNEVDQLATRAGLRQHTLSSRWPQRWILQWTKPDPT